MKQTILILLLLAWAEAAQAVVTYTATASGNWSSASTWSASAGTLAYPGTGTGDVAALNGKLVTLNTNVILGVTSGAGTISVASGAWSLSCTGGDCAATLLNVPNGANLTFTTASNNFTSKLLVNSGGTLTATSTTYYVTGGGTLSSGGTIVVPGDSNFYLYTSFPMSVYGSVVQTGTGTQNPRFGTYNGASTLTIYSGGSVNCTIGCLSLGGTTTVLSGGTLTAGAIYNPLGGGVKLYVNDGATVSLCGNTFPERTSVLLGVLCRSGSGTAYGDASAGKVLTTASAAGTYNAPSFAGSDVWTGSGTWGVTGSLLTPSLGTGFTSSLLLTGNTLHGTAGTLGSTWTVNSPSQILSPAIAGGVGGVSYTGTAQAGSAQNRGIRSGGALSIEPFSLLAMSSALYQFGGELAIGCLVVGFGAWLFKRFIVPDLRRPIAKKRKRELVTVGSRTLMQARDREMADTKVAANTNDNQLLNHLIDTFKVK